MREGRRAHAGVISGVGIRPAFDPDHILLHRVRRPHVARDCDRLGIGGLRTSRDRGAYDMRHAAWGVRGRVGIPWHLALVCMSCIRVFCRVLS